MADELQEEVDGTDGKPKEREKLVEELFQQMKMRTFT